MNKLVFAVALMLILSTYGILADTSSESEKDIPKNCIYWYDGCNDCKLVDGKIVGCTERACLVQNQPKCITYSDYSDYSQKQKSDCMSWYDGCNTCTYLDDGSYACTDMACETYKEPRCLDDSKVKEQKECKYFFDGCNTCLYDEDGVEGKCTEKACIKYDSPKCLDSSYVFPTKETGPIEFSEGDEGNADEKGGYLCSGCELDNKCYPLGYRKDGNFCSDSYTFTTQIESENMCENNFECSSNLCLSGKCVNGSLVDKILNWFKGFFG